MKPIPSARVSPSESLVHLLDERRRRLWRRYLLEGALVEIHLGQAVEGHRWLGGTAWCRWRARRGLPSSCGDNHNHTSGWGCHMDVGSGCLQRTAVVDIAWQLSVRRGTASVGGACGTIIVGQLGLQRTAAGCSTLLGNSGVVHRRMAAQATTWLASMAAVATTWVAQHDAVVWRACFGCLMGILEHGATH